MQAAGYENESLTGNRTYENIVLFISGTAAKSSETQIGPLGFFFHCFQRTPNLNVPDV